MADQPADGLSQELASIVEEEASCSLPTVARDASVRSPIPSPAKDDASVRSPSLSPSKSTKSERMRSKLDKMKSLLNKIKQRKPFVQVSQENVSAFRVGES